jgi:signal transduction histidine kinase
MQQAVQTTGFNADRLVAAGLAETAIEAAEAGLAAFNAAEGKGVRSERRRVETVVETLSTLRGASENLAEVAHDARNMVTALGLYCDLLEEPGVLNPAFQHYGGELRLVATASRRLVEKLVALDAHNGFSRGSAFGASMKGEAELSGSAQPGRMHRWDLMPAAPINDLAAELGTSRNLLAALAGPSIALTLEVEGGALPVRLTGEDLTRILVNLVKNATEAMPEGGSIRLSLRERLDAESLTLTVDDSGPGVPCEVLEKIFNSGYSSHANGSIGQNERHAGHRGLGLFITRSIIEAAGGSIHATNLVPKGARFEIDLPISSH